MSGPALRGFQNRASGAHVWAACRVPGALGGAGRFSGFFRRGFRHSWRFFHGGLGPLGSVVSSGEKTRSAFSLGWMRPFRRAGIGQGRAGGWSSWFGLTLLPRCCSGIPAQGQRGAPAI